MRIPNAEPDCSLLSGNCCKQMSTDKKNAGRVVSLCRRRCFELFFDAPSIASSWASSSLSVPSRHPSY
jgi:hypothetical protein